MSVRVTAQTVSRTVVNRLRRGPRTARVLAVFELVCDLVTPEGEIVALVTPRVGNGPLNVVVNESAGLFAGLEAGTPASLTEDAVHLERLEVDLREAAVWEPRPDWDSLRRRRAVAAASVPLVQALLAERAPADSLAALTEAPPTPGAPRWFILDALRRAKDDLWAGWEGDETRLRQGARRVAGLGEGLTPSGDDFLMGVMLWAWLDHRDPHSLCRTLAEAAAGRTTALSAALLRATSRGECSTPWHALLRSLCGGSEPRVEAAVRDVLAFGATSGADSLAGLVWAALEPKDGRGEKRQEPGVC